MGKRWNKSVNHVLHLRNYICFFSNYYIACRRIHHGPVVDIGCVPVRNIFATGINCINSGMEFYQIRISFTYQVIFSDFGMTEHIYHKWICCNSRKGCISIAAMGYVIYAAFLKANWRCLGYKRNGIIIGKISVFGF